MCLCYHHQQQQLNSPTWALAFLRSFCQLKYPAIASSDFMTSLFQGGVVSTMPAVIIQLLIKICCT
jgi:hypothetical protein